MLTRILRKGKLFPVGEMPQLSVVFFGSGSPASCAALERLAEACEVTAVVVPKDTSGAPIRQMAVARHIPLVDISELSQTPDLFCVDTFPQILDARTLSLPRIGSVNVHQSLLPRHRGPDPLFWTYFYDEKETGATVHWMTDKVDAGDIVLQERIPIRRGTAGTELYMELASMGARLLAEAVIAIGNGSARRTQQKEQFATADPSPWKMTWSIPYDAWDAERLWHFCRGVIHLQLPPLTGAESVDKFEIMGHDQRPGTICREKDFLLIYARDGRVRLRMRSLRARMRQWLARRVRI